MYDLAAVLLLASIHDVSPRFEGEVDRLAICCSHMSAPRRDARCARPLGRCADLAGSASPPDCGHWADAGVEMFLHGWFHHDDGHEGRRAVSRHSHMTAGEGEFLGLSDAEALERSIRAGRKPCSRTSSAGPIAGFIAPAWLYGPARRAALADCAIPLAEDHWRVWSPATGAACARSGDHLGEPDATAARLVARGGRGITPAADLHSTCRCPSARLPGARPGEEHREHHAEPCFEPPHGPLF